MAMTVSAPTIDFNLSDITEMASAQIQARFQIAALRTQQDMQIMQGRELARLMEPHKGQNIDTYA
jgi:hypothetical protein